MPADEPTLGFLARPAQPDWLAPACQAAECRMQHRLWRRVRWRHAGLSLQGAWYCSPECFEAAARRLFIETRQDTMPRPPVRHRIPLGLMLLSRGQLTNAQLRLALEAQHNCGSRRIGEWLEDMGFVSEQQITAALAMQWACPVLSVSPDASLCTGMLPFALLESRRMLPVRFVSKTRVLLMAFADGVDYPALRAIEQMLDCRTEACLVSRRFLDAGLERMRSGAGGDLLFDNRDDPAEAARITCGYALKSGAHSVRIAVCGRHVWIRLLGNNSLTSLLFRNLSANSAEVPGKLRSAG